MREGKRIGERVAKETRRIENTGMKDWGKEVSSEERRRRQRRDRDEGKKIEEREVKETK